MSITIDLTGLDGEKLEQAKAKAEELMAQFVCKEYANDRAINIMAGNIALSNVHYITLDVDNTMISFLDAFEREVAYLSIKELKFNLSNVRENTFEISEV